MKTRHLDVLVGKAPADQVPASVALIVNVPGRLVGFGEPGTVQLSYSQSVAALDNTVMPAAAVYEAELCQALEMMMAELLRIFGERRHVLRTPPVTWQPKFLVLRLANEVPDGFFGWWRLYGYEGKWLDRQQLRDATLSPTAIPDGTGWKAHPTGRYEIREDGTAAQVYEVRPQ